MSSHDHEPFPDPFQEDLDLRQKNLTLRAAYDAGCRQGTRVWADHELHGPPGRLHWRPGKPEAHDAEVRADALDSFAVALSSPWTDFRDRLPDVRARPDLEQLVAEYQRGFTEYCQRPHEQP